MLPSKCLVSGEYMTIMGNEPFLEKNKGSQWEG